MKEDGLVFSAEKPVLVIGGAGVDIVGRLKSELRTDTSNPAQIRYSFGGVARNVAENLARLGQPVRLMTAVGADESADRLLDVLVGAGVDIGAVLRSAEGHTGTYLAVLDSAGSLQIALDDMRIVSGLTPQYIRQHAGLFEEASMLFIDANLTKDTLRTIMSLARQAHLPVFADPTSALLAHRLRPYISRFFMITPNSSEASILCEPSVQVTNRRQALQAAKCLVSQGVGVAIVTLAEQGLCYATSEISGHIPALRTGVLDPTGAGDALVAAVIFAILNGIEIDEAMRLGVSAASLTLRYRGAVVPDLSLEKLYDRLVV
jgi:pseudouridine kinase